MPLTIPTVNDPRDPSRPVADAHAAITYFALDLANHKGRIDFGVFASAEAFAAGAQPISRISVALGQEFPIGLDPPAGAAPGRFPTAAELLGDPTLAAAYATISARFEQIAAGVVPGLKGAIAA